MRTTIDIPDELYRQVKSQAALKGVQVRDLIEEGLRCVLATSVDEASRRAEFPLHRSRRPGALSADDVRRAEDQMLLDEDTKNAGAM
jgi:hypothetical protein